MEERKKNRFKRNKTEFQKYHIWDADCYESKDVEWAFGYVNWELGEEVQAQDANLGVIVYEWYLKSEQDHLGSKQKYTKE